MRALELLLLLTTLVATLSLFRPPTSRSVRIALIGAPTLALLLHLGFEGWRWQLLPAYLAALLVIALLSARRSGWPAATFGLVPLALGAALAWALPVLESAPLPGPAPVGVTHLHWTDPGRPDFDDPTSGAPRELMLSVWYPANPEARGPRAAYFPDFEQVRPELAAKLGWPSWAVGHLAAFRQRAIENAAPGPGPYPLVLYSHGLNRNRLEAVFRMERLASQGYVVVAIDHPYGADFVRFPDGRVKRFRTEREADDDLDDIEIKRMARVDRWVADLRFVIDRITGLGRDDLDPLWQTVDVERIASMGFSNGGTAAQVLATRDPRIGAVINLDGTPRGPAVDHRFTVPTLMMRSDPPDASDEELARWGIDRAQLQAPSRRLVERMRGIAERAEAAAWVVHLEGSAHSNFTDAPRLSPLSHRLGIGGPIDAERAAQRVDGAIFRFLDLALRAGDRTPLDAWIADSPELEPDA